MQFFKAALTSFVSLFLVYPLAHAQEFSYRDEGVRIAEKDFKDIQGIRLGKANLKLGLSEELQHDSNVFLGSTDRKSDNLSITSPRFLLNVPIGIDERHLFQAYYNADVGTFADYKSQNYVDQHALLNGNFKLPFGFFNAQNDFQDTVDRAGTEFTDQVRRRENNSKVTLGIEGNKLSNEFAYAHYLKRFVKEDFRAFDYDEDTYTLTSFYQVMPKTKALVELEHSDIGYLKDSSRNGSYDQIMVGIRGDILSKTIGIAKAGYQTRSYDTAGLDGFNGFVSEVGLDTKFSERTETNLKYESSAIESVYENNTYYRMNAVSLDLRQDLIRNFAILLTSEYSRNAYPEETASIQDNRLDNVYTETAALQYTLKESTKIKIGYQYLQDDSNVETSNYIRNLIFLKTDIHF